jgi:hypothetical protein
MQAFLHSKELISLPKFAIVVMRLGIWVVVLAPGLKLSTAFAVAKKIRSARISQPLKVPMVAEHSALAPRLESLEEMKGLELLL